MNVHERYGLTRIINAAGSYTPVGVSRSSPQVGAAVSDALGRFFVIDELQATVSLAVCERYPAADRAAAVCHCVSAAVTIAVAAAMAGEDPEAVAALPDATGMPHKVVIPAGHCVNYGHPITTSIRLAGAKPIPVGTARACSVDEIDQAVAQPDTAALMLVSSRLVQGRDVDMGRAVAAAHRHGVPVILDGAAQDRRIDALLATGADVVLVSGHKYLASPTAGLMIGRRDFVAACRAQEKGVGRAMKATKEALVGVLAALEIRDHDPNDAWREAQDAKVDTFIAAVEELDDNMSVERWPDPSGMPFSRVRLRLGEGHGPHAAHRVVDALARADPSIRVMTHELAHSVVGLELVPLDAHEIKQLVTGLTRVLSEMNDEAPGPDAVAPNR